MLETNNDTFKSDMIAEIKKIQAELNELKVIKENIVKKSIKRKSAGKTAPAKKKSAGKTAPAKKKSAGKTAPAKKKSAGKMTKSKRKTEG